MLLPLALFLVAVLMSLSLVSIVLILLALIAPMGSVWGRSHFYCSSLRLVWRACSVVGLGCFCSLSCGSSLVCRVWCKYVPPAFDHGLCSLEVFFMLLYTILAWRASRTVDPRRLGLWSENVDSTEGGMDEAKVKYGRSWGSSIWKMLSCSSSTNNNISRISAGGLVGSQGGISLKLS